MFGNTTLQKIGFCSYALHRPVFFDSATVLIKTLNKQPERQSSPRGEKNKREKKWTGACLELQISLLAGFQQKQRQSCIASLKRAAVCSERE